MRKIIVMLLAVAAVSACGSDKVNQGKNVSFDGQRFKAKLEKNKDDRSDFVVTVFEVSKSLAGAREAGRYEGTKYCIKNYGTSEVEWSVGPDTADGGLVIVEDTLTFRGNCVGW